MNRSITDLETEHRREHERLMVSARLALENAKDLEHAKLIVEEIEVAARYSYGAHLNELRQHPEHTASFKKLGRDRARTLRALRGGAANIPRQLLDRNQAQPDTERSFDINDLFDLQEYIIIDGEELQEEVNKAIGQRFLKDTARNGVPHCAIDLKRVLKR